MSNLGASEIILILIGIMIIFVPIWAMTILVKYFRKTPSLRKLSRVEMSVLIWGGICLVLIVAGQFYK
jgi:hypothetical protein